MAEVGFNPLWFMGVVAEAADGANNGRVKVRAFGIHPPEPRADQENDGEEDFTPGIERPANTVETDDLPWAPVLQSGAGMGIPAVGDWVFGCFMDGRDAQHPIVMGVIPGAMNGIPQNPEGGNPYTPLSAEVAERMGQAPLDPWLTGEQVSATPAVAHMAAFTQQFRSGVNAGVQLPPPAIPHRDYGAQVLRGGNSNNRVVVNNSGVVVTSPGGQVQIDNTGNISIYSNAKVSVYGTQNDFVSRGHTNAISQGAYRITSGGSGVHIETDGDFTVNCSSFKVNARDTAYLNAGGSADISGAKVHVRSQTDHIDLNAQGKLRTFSGAGTFMDVGGIEGLYITSKRVNWFNFGDWKLTSLLKVDINTPALLKIQGSIASFIGTGVANFKGNGVTNIHGSIVNIDKFINMGSGAATPPLPLTPFDLGLMIGMPLGPILSDHFASVPKLPVLRGSRISVTGSQTHISTPPNDITFGTVDDPEDTGATGAGGILSSITNLIG